MVPSDTFHTLLVFCKDVASGMRQILTARNITVAGHGLVILPCVWNQVHQLTQYIQKICLPLLILQEMKLVDHEYCLPLLLGCPMYEHMIQWWVFIAVNQQHIHQLQCSCREPVRLSKQHISGVVSVALLFVPGYFCSVPILCPSIVWDLTMLLISMNFSVIQLAWER